MEVSELHSLFRQALDADDYGMTMHKLLVELRAQGVTRESLLSALAAFRQQARDETEDDLITANMDCFYGWCAPNLRID